MPYSNGDLCSESNTLYPHWRVILGETMKAAYIHGYNPRENIRLQDQASTLVELLHSDTLYPAGSRVLEAGCGVGAQTVTLARNSPAALITSIDISTNSVEEAARNAAASGINNVRFQQADIFNLPFAPESFDHIFVCFVLEHLSQPMEALHLLKKALKTGGTITVIEGDHGSAYFHPDSEAAHQAIQCQVELQRRAGGNALIGRELYPLLCKAGYRSVRISPRMVYVDASKPELVDGFTRKTFTAMIEGIRNAALQAEMVEKDLFERGVRDLYRTAENDGVFCYTFFKAFGEKE
ncbi:MAG TPA: SAM-dependent methyltransferase [Syntrophus sp. (in: bacteria)]|nr:SAM-dependent methyltransferase [Syntrophus sp. (in: bacteria)]